MKRRLSTKRLTFVCLVLSLTLSLFTLYISVESLSAPFATETSTVKEDVVLKTTTANFTMGADFAFYRVEVNSTHVWMDKTYSSKHYTRYCIWVTSPSSTALTVNTWFASTTSTATLTITSPLSTNINVKAYSPNFISASATDVVSYSWNSGNKTLSMVANSDTSSTFTIHASVTETAFNNAPENVEVIITDMEGCGNWVFSEEKYYTFQAKYWDKDGTSDLDLMKIAFTDGNTWVNASYDAGDDEWTLDSGGDIVHLQRGTVTALDSNLLQVTFPIYLETSVLDALNVDIYMYCKDISGAEDDWQKVQDNYFNIYNLGGHALGSLEVSGNAGRLPGGDIFDFYAYNGSSVEASFLFRNLQHVKMLTEVTAEVAGAAFNITYGIDYCLEDSDDFITGWEIVLDAVSITVGSVRRHNWTARWYNRGTLVKTEKMWTFPNTGNAPGENMTTRFWVDLWFNKINASTTVGGRINSYEYPMWDTAPVWLRWWSTNWGLDDRLRKQTMMFTNLLDENSEIVSTQQIKLVRVRCNLTVLSVAYQYLLVRDYDVFDLTFAPLSEPFQGVQTPPFEETLVPKMEQRGLAGMLWSALMLLGDMITAMYGPVLLGFWNVFVAFLDSIATALGFPNAFSTFLNMLANAWLWLVDSVGYVVSMLTSVFSFLAVSMTKFASLLSQVVTQWILIVQGVISFLDSGLGTVGGVWNMLGMTNWLILFAILYPLWLVFMWDEEGLQPVLDHLTFVYNVINTLVHLFITLIQHAISIIGRIIESIPIIE